MEQTDVTITLPLTEHGLWVILTALGIGVGSWIVWLILSEQSRATRHNPATLLSAFAVILAPVWLVILAGTLWQVWLMLSGPPLASGSGPSLGMGALLAALLGAPFLIWGTILKQRNTEIQHRLADLNDAALFNDKINAASEGLGARKQVTRSVGVGVEESILTEWQDDLVARASAIDRLEGLAHERPTDAPRIARMLSVYLRELSKDYPAKDQSDVDDGHTQFFHHWSEELKPARSDLETSAKTLAELNKIHSIAQEEIPLDLREANLQGSNLRGLNFDGANLQAARIEGAQLYGVRLEKADLSGARMDGTILTEARMEGAILSRTSLNGADLTKANMEGAILTRVDMDSTTKLVGASLTGAVLRGVDYSDVWISEKQINSIFGDASVILPAGLNRPAHWPDWTLPAFGSQAFLDEWRKWQKDPESYTPPPKPGG